MVPNAVGADRVISLLNITQSVHGPLKQMDGMDVNGPVVRKDGLKPCKWLKCVSKIFENYFQMDNLIDRMGYRSHFFASDSFYTTEPLI